jgi:hypothetical protein
VVIASDAQVRIADTAPLHYLGADPHGDVAVVEFLDGKMQARRGSELPVPALANDTYASEVESWERGADTGSRFSRAGRRALDFRASRVRADSLAYAFDTLRGVAQQNTQWSIVYDLGKRELFFRTRGQQSVRRLALADVVFGCSSGVRAVSLDAAGPDLATALRPLTQQQHRTFLASVYRQTPFLAQTPPERIAHLASEPLEARCAAPAL